MEYSHTDEESVRCVCGGGLLALGRPSPVVEIVFHKEIRIHEILPQLLEISNHQPEQFFRHLPQQADPHHPSQPTPYQGESDNAVS